MYDETTWQTQPRKPPLPIHNPGVTINQMIPRKNLPLYNWPNPGMRNDKTAAVPGRSMGGTCIA
jgi:hypothetical protein